MNTYINTHEEHGQIILSNTYKSIENINLSLDGKKGVYFITVSNDLNKKIHHQKIIKQ